MASPDRPGMPLRSCRAVTGLLVLTISLLTAGFSPQSALDLLENTAVATGEAWCRHANYCYSTCDPEVATYRRR